MRRSSPQHNPLDQPAANQAGSSFPIVHLVNVLKTPRLTVAVPVVAQRATFVLNRPIQNNFDAFAQLGDLLFCKPIRRHARIDCRMEQRLIRINIPHPR